MNLGIEAHGRGMNLGIEALPARCDVLVVGAGPAGSAAAQQLARGGRDVVLVDRHAFPRDKVCGDGLIPDALNALERLGVRDAVLAEARRSSALRCVAPGGGRIDVPGLLAVLPRRRLDAIVCEAAVAAGARMFAPLSFVAPRRDGSGRVVGATLQHAGLRRDIATRWIVLATGAETPALIAAGLCERRSASGMAVRGYLENPSMAAGIDRLEVVWHRRLGSGYGWIFPCGGDVFNIGVGATLGPPHARAGGSRGPGLRDLFRTFTDIHPLAGELVATGRWLGDAGEALKGAPLRCSLSGARLAVPGLLVAGEAAGSTYALTGEGIGKAMETGLHAADAILATDDDEDDAGVRADYAARIAALRPRFAIYDDAQRAVRHPWLLDLLVWSARRSPARLQRLAGVLDESYLPTDATSVRGVLRRLLSRR